MFRVALPAYDPAGQGTGGVATCWRRPSPLAGLRMLFVTSDSTMRGSVQAFARLRGFRVHRRHWTAPRRSRACGARPSTSQSAIWTRREFARRPSCPRSRASKRALARKLIFLQRHPRPTSASSRADARRALRARPAGGCGCGGARTAGEARGGRREADRSQASVAALNCRCARLARSFKDKEDLPVKHNTALYIRNAGRRGDDLRDQHRVSFAEARRSARGRREACVCRRSRK